MPYQLDRKSTRLNSSHTIISYAVFCLKKKKRRCYGGCVALVALDTSLRGLVALSSTPGRGAKLSYTGPRVSHRSAPFLFFFLIMGRPPRTTLFPSRPLFR